MLDDFLVRATLAGLGTTLAAGPMGCFVLWRRMAYFGDATAHAAILGVALALAFDLSVTWGILAIAGLMAAAIHGLAGRALGMDTVLGVLAHGALALGLVAVALIPGARVNLEAWLFGDILTVSRGDLGLIWAGSVAVAAVLMWQWRALLTATLSPELAHAAGLDPRRAQLLLTLLLALVVAVAIQVVGALLITAMLIIPAATARSLSRTPEAMVALSVAAGAVSVLGGLRLSLTLDTPVGPTIVVVAVFCFALSRLLALVRPSGA
jgi:zinc transport system permease protein